MTHAQPDDQPVQPVKAALWMIGAILSFSAMAIAGRAASFELDTFEMMTYRSMVGLVIVLVFGATFGTLGQITFRHLNIHFFRNLAHFTGQNLWFYAITVSPLALVFALEFTSPLWVMIFAALFLGERLTKVKLFAGALGFIGVLIVVQPGSAPINSGMVTAALAAIGFAATAILTKRLTRTETTTCILFYLAVIQLGLGLAACFADGQMALPSTTTAPWLLLIGICGMTAHYCLTTALKIAPASAVMPMDFVRLPAIAVIGMLFYAEPLQWAVLFGAVLIFAANYLNILTTQRAARKL